MTTTTTAASNHRAEKADKADARAAAKTAAGEELVRLPRRRVDEVLIGFGVIATIVFAVAGGLLLWGNSFSNDYVHKELASQNVFFPSKADLVAEGRTDLVGHAGQQVTTGSEAQAYAGYIAGHLEGIAGGKTYSEIDDRGAAAKVTAAEKAGASKADVAKLQATADELKGQRDTLFKGETLRGLLLSAYAWSTVGMIAGIAAWVAVAAAVLMALITGAGVVHLRRTTH
ncbi:hypothetical protein KSP35_21005 [Aquihabitans sp. G128]|uniref:hypothetical protein n=1 Tax=Aquihabitans sp. G128 TaxID=2849779 RepID=UPI001C2288B7|nr:hypothetical protein [Aquihabitans sp. G128]QXC60772.1 hypothetical protein KSP35_21005 [Aquihabitans sp. G128]